MAGTGFPWIILAAAIYGILHSILAANSAKALAVRWLGQAVYHRFYRLLYVLIALITFLPLPTLVILLPDRRLYTIPAPWLYLTLLIQAAAGLVLLIAVLQTGAMSFLGLRQFLAYDPRHGKPFPEKLVVDGWYRWVRHPLYTASYLILWLTPVLTWNILALNLGLSIYMFAGTFFEEKKLIGQFGKAYEEYRRSTPRLIPGLQLFRKG